MRAGLPLCAGGKHLANVDQRGCHDAQAHPSFHSVVTAYGCRISFLAPPNALEAERHVVGLKVLGNGWTAEELAAGAEDAALAARYPNRSN
jgi:hypothetical protein